VKIPIECQMTGSREIQDTSRGEYATALNCTITNASEKTMPVSAIIPEVIDERIANATLLLIVDVTVRNRCSSRGRIMPAGTAIAA